MARASRDKYAGKMPEWLPDWRDASQYPKALSKNMWAWEFLRRNPEYQKLWEESIFPYLEPDGYNSDAAPIKDLTAVLRDKFGILGPLLIPPSSSSKSKPLIIFEGTGCRQLIPPKKITLPDGSVYLGEVKFKDTEICYVLDLALPIDPQIDRIKQNVKGKIKSWQKSGRLPPSKNKRASITNYREYLRLLDGKLCNASVSEMAAVIYPETDNDWPETLGDHKVRRNLAVAETLRDGGYRFVPTTSKKG